MEQSQIGKSGFPPQFIHNTKNMIELTPAQHVKITAYYNSNLPDTNGMLARNWLAGKSFEEQYQFGIKTLKDLLGIII